MALGLALWFGLIFCGALMVLGVVVGAKALYKKRTVFVMEAPHRDEISAGVPHAASNSFGSLYLSPR